MAPEQADPPRGRYLDRRVDIFAMGIVLWECLSQRRLVTGDARAAMSKILDLEFEPPSKSNPEVPPELDAITKRALERRPEDRYPTALAMREAIEKYQRAKGDFVGPTEIGKLVTDLFRAERDDLRRQIRMQMAELGESARDLVVTEEESRRHAAEAEAAQPALEPPPPPPPAPSLVESVGSLRAVRTHVTGAVDRPSGRNSRVVVAVLALALAGGVGITIRSMSNRASAGARTAESVKIVLRTTPADAVLTLDGAPVKNPFDGTLPRDTAEHRFEAQRAGYVGATKAVRFDHGDMSFDVALEKAPEPVPSAAPVPPAPAAPSSSSAPSNKAKPAPASPSPRSPMQPNLDDDPWR
jgi:hypothetical protein